MTIEEGAEGMLTPEATPSTRIYDARHLQSAAARESSFSDAAFFEEHGFVLLSHESAVEDWDIQVRSGARLAATLAASRDDAVLFRRLATLVTDGPVVGTVDDWCWQGPTSKLDDLVDYLEAPQLATRAQHLAAHGPAGPRSSV